jgi:uncharacterized protein
MAAPWLLRMRWLDLLFAHWSFEPHLVRRFLPGDPALELDLFDGRAWIGVVPFTMTDVSARGVPAIPVFSTFPELNVRTYVTYRGSPGIWFLSLDARSRPTVLGGRAVFHLPYHHADMTARRTGDAIDYRSRRTRATAPAAFEGTYRPTGPVTIPPAASFDRWATQRLRLFAADRRGRVWRTEIEHAPWPLQPAEATLDARSLLASHGLIEPDVDPILHFAGRLDVRGWPPVRA